MKCPLLSLPGAVPAEGADEGVAAHYGDLFREQRALADGTGFVDLSHRGVVTVTGADRLSWLHLLLTQHVSDLPPGQATEALILSAHGPHRARPVPGRRRRDGLGARRAGHASKRCSPTWSR